MSDLVLVRYDLGDEYEIAPRGRRFAEANGLQILDEPPYDRGGRLKAARRFRERSGRPAKPQVSVAEKAAEKKAAPSADQPDTQPSSPKE